jgi:hypothetical protein
VARCDRTVPVGASGAATMRTGAARHATAAGTGAWRDDSLAPAREDARNGAEGTEQAAEANAEIIAKELSTVRKRMTNGQVMRRQSWPSKRKQESVLVQLAGALAAINTGRGGCTGRRLWLSVAMRVESSERLVSPEIPECDPKLHSAETHDSRSCCCIPF